MDDQELIRTLSHDQLLAVVEILAFALVYPDDDLGDLEDEMHPFPKTIANYGEYQRLKLMQLIINALVYEAEQSTVKSFQLALPL